jgi:hypothetical protein
MHERCVEFLPPIRLMVTGLRGASTREQRSGQGFERSTEDRGIAE